MTEQDPVERVAHESHPTAGIGEHEAGAQDDSRWNEQYAQILAGQHSGKVKTQDLLSWYGRTRRGAVVNKIITDELETAGLSITPAIEEADYYGYVLISPSQPKEQFTSGANLKLGLDLHADPRESAETADSSTPKGWVLSSLKEDAEPLDYLCYGATVQDAIDMMRTSGHSRLPLFFDDDRASLVGTIILEELAFDRTDKDTKLIDRVKTGAIVASTDDKLFDWIPMILNSGFIYGRNSSNEIVQIYTAHDVATHVHSIAQMFLRVNELEDHVRAILTRHSTDAVKTAHDAISSPNAIRRTADDQLLFTSADLRPSHTDESAHVAYDYTFADYMKCFGNKDFWTTAVANSTHGTPLDRDKCLRSLNDARLARNTVMHMKGSGLPQATAASFEALGAWVRRLNAPTGNMPDGN